MEAQEVIGLVPAAGAATRVAPLPCSKEVYPIGFRREDGKAQPKVACHYLLEKMERAGARKAYIVLREGKWDIPAYFGDGQIANMHLAYLMMDRPYGAPFTVGQASPFVQDARVVFGFPDILFQPDDAFVHLLERQAQTGADIVLGLFPTATPHKMDMVEQDAEGRVRTLVIKPARTHLRYTWIVAVWTPVFTAFLREYIEQACTKHSEETLAAREWYVGEVIQEAIAHELHVDSVLFPEGQCTDVGTPEALLEAVRRGAQAAVQESAEGKEFV